MEIYLLVIACLLSLLCVLLIVLLRPKKEDQLSGLHQSIAGLQIGLSRIESANKEDFRISREEHSGTARNNREELTIALKEINKTLSENLSQLSTTLVNQQKESTRDNQKSLHDFTIDQGVKFASLELVLKELVATTTTQLEKIGTKVELQLSNLREEARMDANLMREALLNSIKGFESAFEKQVKSFNDLQQEKFSRMELRQNEMVSATGLKLESIRTTVEEKLEKTLSERLGQSFKTVGDQLMKVQQGLGEMQALAADVGGLKKVLSNVKLRGGVGEVQLAMLLEQMLAPNQYEANVRTKAGSNDPVEFAIKLPGRSEDEAACVYLPIDAKFPKDSYEHLLNAYEHGNPEEIETATRNLEATIRKMAKDIRDKYISPPHTTDFAIMFLPFESIYAEVLRRSSLVDQLRDEFKISIAGPTTLMAILNSMQMGFRTLALQKRSSEVWQVLSKVKTEFENFGGMLGKAQKNFQTGLGQLEDVMGTRTRAILRQLKTVESLPSNTVENNLLIPENIILPQAEDDAL